MAWTTPRTWSVNELVSAANMNAHVRDNLSYLYDQSMGLMLGSRTTLGGAAATLGVTGLDTTWEILFFRAHLRGAAVATSDTVRLRLGGASLDTTAANYYGYNDNVAGTGPTRSVQENLGATAGIFTGTYIPAASATASYFADIWGWIQNGNQSAEYKTGMFWNKYQLANTTGNVALQWGQGYWLNVANTLQQISFITASGSNIAAGSWLSVYGGNA